MKSTTRLESIDALRGLMMILMALDHVRDYLGNTAFDYTSYEVKTNIVLFFTRWITNLCAPTFIFLVGVSMYLALKAGKTKKELRFFLVTRGVWMIVADFFIMHVAWTFSFDFSVIEFDVLTVTGASMILLSLLIFLPRFLLFVLCAGVLVSHNLLDGHDLNWLKTWNWLHSPEHFVMTVFQQQVNVYPWYVMIPWVFIPGLGYLFGSTYDLPTREQSKRLMLLGGMCLTTFFIARYINFYGDPNPWVLSKNMSISIFSFLNVTKYPPSLLYFLITLGLSFFILALFDRYNNHFINVLSVYGKTPFTFYVLHVFVIHTIALMLAYVNFGPAAMRLYMNVKFISFDPTVLNLTPYGYGIYTVYSIWLFVVVLFYPFCKWYGNFKQRNRKITLLSYL